MRLAISVCKINRYNFAAALFQNKIAIRCSRVYLRAWLVLGTEKRTENGEGRYRNNEKLFHRAAGL
jgi:hypothetical protein